jgi:predicted cupin superfamily sugar epimerase
MPSSSAIKPFFTASKEVEDSPSIRAVTRSLSLSPHIEGGFFAETDRAPDTVPSPFQGDKSTTTDLAPQRPGFNPAVRNSSTSIFYLLTPRGPQGGFHRNKGRTVHTLHRGRGQYVLIHADEDGAKKRVETFIVGHNVEKGEKLQWIVDGGKYKASFLLPDEENGSTSEGLLISETVVPGFEYCDHDFLSRDGLKEMVSEEQFEELHCLLSPLGGL